MVLFGIIIGNGVVVGVNFVVRGFIFENIVIVGVLVKIIKKYNYEIKLWEKV